MLDRLHIPLLNLHRLDPRGEVEIDSDLEAEFAFHLEQRRESLLKQGLDGTEARYEALRRFGDVDKFKAQCRRIALEERIMLQKINLVLMIVVLLTVVGISVQMFVTQRFNTLAIQAISAQLSEQSRPASSSSVPARALIEGEVTNPGWYDIGTDPGRVTLLHELLGEAGGVSGNQMITLSNAGRNVDGRRFDGADLLSENPPRIVVRPGDELTVATKPEPRRPQRAPRRPSAEPSAGIWRQVDEAGHPVEDGMHLTIIGADDIRNLDGSPIGTLRVPGVAHDIRLKFEGKLGAQNLDIRDSFEEIDFGQNGRWQVGDDDAVLELNLSRVPGAGPQHERIRFMRAEDNPPAPPESQAPPES